MLIVGITALVFAVKLSIASILTTSRTAWHCLPACA